MALVTQKRGSGAPKKILAVLVVAGIAAGSFFLFRQVRLPAPASATLTSDLPAVGRKTSFKLDASEPAKGLESVSVVVDGAGLSNVPVPVVFTAGDKEAHVAFVVGKESFPTLKPGNVKITATIQAKGTKLRTPAPVVVVKEMTVKLEPPSLAPSSQFIHPSQGGAEVVVYEVGQNAVKDGVQAGDWFFPGHVLPGGSGPTQHFAFFAVPYDWDGVDENDAKNKIKLVAEDDIGNRAEMSFIHKYFPRPMGKDTINLEDPFLTKVTGEIYARMPELNKKGELLADYIALNKDLRVVEMNELHELSKKSAEKFLWTTTFQRLKDAAVKGAFAQRRTYMYQAKNVDTEDHLGFDLASLEHAPVTASNDGVIAMAKYFGIFGNCVVIDHGYGLMSLYGHLQTMSVKEGDAVKAGQELGKTGSTGLAGGDHLHFTMLVDGLPVTPIEWWDGHWIKDRLKLKLGDSIPWQESADTVQPIYEKHHRK
jgi:murein DD-endopeptidase MepM/ murein hydrolase activator NlpD